MYIDAHTHLIYKETFQNVPKHLKKIHKMMKNNNISYVVSNTSTPAYFHLIEHEKRYPEILSAIAINRNLAKNKATHQEHLNLLRKNIEELQPEAIGEAGLDYDTYFGVDFAPFNQQYILEQEFQLAKQFDLPLIIHSWDSDEDLLSIFRRHHAEDMRIHIHGTQINKEFMQDFIDLGCYFSLSYSHHFNEPEMQFWIENVPFDKLMIETDSPYNPTVKNEHMKSSPVDVIDTYKLYCQKTSKELESVINQVNTNFKRLYKI